MWWQDIPSEAWGLVGVIVGGVGSTYGAHMTTKLDRIRSTRIEIYRYLLPTVWDEESGVTPAFGFAEPDWQKLWRAAETSGRADKRFAARTRQLNDDYARYLRAANDNKQVNEETGKSEADPILYGRHLRAGTQLEKTVGQWHRWLRKKL